MDFFLNALPGIVSTVMVGLLSVITVRVRHLSDQWDVLRESQRNQLKASIVSVYEHSTERGYITPMELETCNRMTDSYFALGGNHYIHAVIKRLNEDVKIKGEPIPESERSF